VNQPWTWTTSFRPKGYGVVNILAADELMASPKVYATLLLWLLTALFEHLPEVGDLPKPKLAFFFDEAHLLFNEIPKALLTKIEQVVRLVRSKGVGVFLVTQNPSDIPDNVLGQLGNRVQHALRAFTPREQKGVQAAAETFRPNPEFKTANVLTELGVGEALVSFLDEKGQPNVVERAFIVPPRSQIGPITPEQRNQLMQESLVAGRYEQVVYRESAYERLSKPTHPAVQSGGEDRGLVEQVVSGVIGGISGQRSRQSDTVVQAATKNVVRSFTSSIGRRITNSILRSIFGGPKRG
jgi:DNA helicase HerA-like ATPase